jgi:RNA polymerase sigma-70 factor (ECF subfamily)
LEDAAGAPDIAQALDATRMDLDSALARLPDDGRDVLLLHDVEGYTHGEIARMLGIEEGTSKSRLARARGAMRVMLRPPAAAEH